MQEWMPLAMADTAVLVKHIQFQAQVFIMLVAEAVVQVGHQQVHTAWAVQEAVAEQVLMEEKVV